LIEMDDKRRGTLLGVTAYLIWGFAALYWIQTEPVEATDLVAHRVLWSLPVVVLCLVAAGSGRLGRALALFRQPRTLAVMGGAALFSSFNWGVFMWAVTHGRATEASLGYFLLPLINVLIGVTLFRESIDRAQKVGVAFAILAVLLQLIYHGGLPLVALGVAVSFGLYGAIRKGTHVESMEGLLLEMSILAPFALAWLVYRDGAGLGLYGIGVDLFLLGAGVFTAVPLMAYVAASRMLPLTALGLVFYIGPTTQLLVAVWVFDEPFDTIQLIAFGLVWVGLIIVTVSNMRRAGALRRYRARPGP
jgi:chloramphenicol-sensitive protein RarD